MNPMARTVLLVLLCVGLRPQGAAGETDWLAHIHVDQAPPIPAFARMYRTACSTCHTAAPKLNVLGEAFRLHGYQMPESELLVRRDDPIDLGAEPWKELWPRAIWPGTLPGQFPLSLRIQTDLFATRRAGSPAGLNYHFPHEVYLLAGTPLGDGLGVFFEAEWAPDEGLEVIQAKVAFQDLIPGLPSGSGNLWAGLLNPQLLTFTDRQTDRAARQKFSWQDFRLSDLEFEGPGETLQSRNDLVLGTGIPALELNGRLGGRFRYGVGLAQGASAPSDDANGSKDLYYHVGYKFGGLDYDGRYDEGGGPVPGTGGQLLDRSVVVEHFGYFGSEARAEQPAGPHRALGIAVRVLRGQWDLGAGWVERRFEDPLGLGADGDATAQSLFAKVEYLAYPWLILSAKGDRFRFRAPEGVRPAGYGAPSVDAARLMPGVIALVRQNLRLVVEGELFAEDEAARTRGERRPHTLWVRLDLAF